MCRNRVYSITIQAEQFDSASEIIDRFYERGDIDRISFSHTAIDQTYQVWVECSTDDLEALKKELQDNQIKLL